MTMTADCEQTRAQMLELVYGELPSDARAQLDAHVAGCAACKAELAALQSTRALVRQRLADEGPPARARAAILQAATAAVPARKPVAAPTRPSFWVRIRAKWTLPTFATVGALAVFLLASRIFMEPEKTYERGRQGLAPPPAEPAAEPAAPPPPGQEQMAEQGKPGPAASSAAKHEAAQTVHRKAAPPKGAAGGARMQAKPAQKGERAEEPLDGLIGAPAPAARSGNFAPPPPSAPRRPAKASIDDRLLDDFADRPMAKEKRAPSAGSGASPPKSVVGGLVPAPAAPAAESEDEQPGPRTRQTPAQRADRLFAQRRWAEAAVAYRELLRDQPDSPEAERWRKRLADCNAALSGQR